jgi:hypothetical protein
MSRHIANGFALATISFLSSRLIVGVGYSLAFNLYMS